MTQYLGPRSGRDGEDLTPERKRELRQIAADSFSTRQNALCDEMFTVLTDPEDKAEHQGLQLLRADLLDDLRRVPNDQRLPRRLPDWLTPNPCDDAATTPVQKWRNGVLQEVRELNRYALAASCDYARVHGIVRELDEAYGRLLYAVVK